MDSRRFEQVRRVFARAVELEPEERERLLAEACAGDDELRREVESLLAADHAPGDLLSGSAMEALALPGAAPVVGRRIGPWEVRGELGVGGMGAVYLAERADGHFEQRVALKLVRRGVSSEQVLRRFEEERRILAQLDHPNIARLLDGGVTDDGVPYFTMEYVDGEPIDRYCDRGRLTIEERIELFRTVCSAVQQAHRNLVVHRDLKPSNILVSASGEVKLLDFGIAKVLDDGGADPARTRTGLRAMTPAYASPEQVRGEPVTTASDVYSLGVVLYELLCGRRPHDVEGASPAELERSICTTAPERPSRAMDRPPTDRPATEAVARARGSSPGHVRRLLRGDLDNICLTALRKEPARRYGSVEALSEDLRRTLRGLPVTARPDTLAYRTQKFVARNRVALAGVAAVVVLIAGLIGFYTRRLSDERDRAVLEARKAAQVSDFLAGLFQVSDPRESGGENLTARQMLDRGAARLDTELRDQPEVLAGLGGVVGDVYRSLGLYDEARPWIEKSLRLNLERRGEDDLATADSRLKLGALTFDTGKPDEAREQIRRALAVQRRHLPPDDLRLAKTLNDLGWILGETDSLDAAEEALDEALRIRTDALGPEEPLVAETLTNLGTIHFNRGELDTAFVQFERALAIQRAALGPDHVLVGNALQNLATVFESRGQPDSAEAYYRASARTLEKALGPDHPERAAPLENLGRLLGGRGRYDEAIALLREAVELERQRGPDHSFVAYALKELAKVQRNRGDLEEAGKTFREALRIYDVAFPDGGLYVASTRINYGRLLREQGDLAGAESQIRHGLDEYRAGLPPGATARWRAELSLGGLLVERRRFAEAESVLVGAYRDIEEARGPDLPGMDQAAARLVELYEAWGKPEEADRYRSLAARARPAAPFD